MTARTDAVTGYVDYTFDEKSRVQNALGYIEWIGTPTPIPQTQDIAVGVVLGYVEYGYLLPAQIGAVLGYIDYQFDHYALVSGVLGYVEYEFIEKAQIGAVLGYVEWEGTPAPIAQTQDIAVSAVLGYVEYEFIQKSELGTVLGYIDYSDPGFYPEVVIRYTGEWWWL